MNDLYKTAYERGFMKAAQEAGMTEGQAIDLFKHAAPSSYPMTSQDESGILQQLLNMKQVANNAQQKTLDQSAPAGFTGGTEGGQIGGGLGGGLGALLGGGLGAGAGYMLGEEEDPTSGKPGTKSRNAGIGALLGGGLGGALGGSLGGGTGGGLGALTAIRNIGKLSPASRDLQLIPY